MSTDLELGRKYGRRAVALYLACTALIVAVGLLGPSVVVLTLTGRHPWLPSYWFDAKPNDWLVSVLIYVAILLGGYGVYLATKALKHGWAPRVDRLIALGIGTTAAVTLVPPMASGDVLIYAAYGRIMSLGGDPYTASPADTIRLGYDPVITATERPWQGARSVYGPIATWIQWLASLIGGNSAQLTVWMLQLSVAISLVVTGLLLVKLVGKDLPAKRRVIMLSLANPLLLWAVLAGAHNDSIAVMFAVIALVLFRRHVFLAGLMLGVAGCTKLSIGLVGVAMLWALRADRRKCVYFCGGGAIAMGGLYAIVGLQAFQQARSQTSFVSTGTPHKVLLSLFGLFLPNGLVRTAIAILAWVGLVVVAILLSQVFPKSLVPQTHPDDPTPAAIRYTAIYAIAWTLTAMYSLPWYDVIAWAALAAVAASKVDGLMVVRTTMLAIAYVPGRDPHARQVAASLSNSLDFFSSRLRDTLCPAIELAVLIGLIVWARRNGAQWWPYDWPRRKQKPLPAKPAEVG
ncbi:polyprenol phosphomannose-dependent alpha 1,6 mannosyltransferase MptB [Kribbella sp.]|uniref:polyprenol phosphomannose-dependent alpha 1,6 mannosyltransferase MptB n=1 Tax=Kribbella sp. TaxID=1871183 RepID=UPI002D452F90|nr:polyprenol phosphomannose-dependent alpha 1,6 mannosyltransferase MptB [Kribbella sp.]HZX08381.1 polyprenol phosphomannose-dependent alpha 1,6 mannosyltransferase MptB [Kribbella sp.]